MGNSQQHNTGMHFPGVKFAEKKTKKGFRMNVNEILSVSSTYIYEGINKKMALFICHSHSLYGHCGVHRILPCGRHSLLCGRHSHNRARPTVSSPVAAMASSVAAIAITGLGPPY